jgi:PhnB protein
MSVIPYLTFQGTCHEAMTFYAGVFGTKIEMIMKAGEMPDYPVADDKKDLIAHASIKIAGGDLYASDDIMGGSGVMAGCSVMVSLPTNPQSKAAFDKLAEGGTVGMPFQPTFWSGGFGTLVDRYGTHWMVSSQEEPAAA